MVTEPMPFEPVAGSPVPGGTTGPEPPPAPPPAPPSVPPLAGRVDGVVPAIEKLWVKTPLVVPLAVMTKVPVAVGAAVKLAVALLPAHTTEMLAGVDWGCVNVMVSPLTQLVYVEANGLSPPGFDAVLIPWLSGRGEGDCRHGTSIEVHTRVPASSDRGGS